MINIPLIFISNDDGVNAKGINSLISMLSGLGEILVVAPDDHRSGAACSITCKQPVTCKLVNRKPGLAVYSCSGTPVDCVKLGITQIADRMPDIVIGGINHGNNASVSVHYSGTMGIVKEACIKGVPAVGLSLDSFAEDADFEPMRDTVRRIVTEVLQKGLPKGTCLNVNFPDMPEYKGVKVCRQTRAEWKGEWAATDHPRGGKVYWLIGELDPAEDDLESDYIAMKAGYVAVTPTTIDSTSYELLDEMKNWKL